LRCAKNLHIDEGFYDIEIIYSSIKNRKYFWRRIYNWDKLKALFLTLDSMTDPFQTTNPQQQGQQWYTDDILGWEDIFAAIPKAKREEEIFAYDDMMEKKYQFNSLPESSEPEVSIVAGTQVQENIPKEIPIESVAVEPVSVVQPQQAVKKEIPKPDQSVPVDPVSIVKTKSPVVTPISTPAPRPAQAVVQQAPVQKIQIAKEIPMIEKVVPVVTKQEVQPIKQSLPSEKQEIEVPSDTRSQTDVQKKFSELFSTTKKIYELKDTTGITEETFDILWANNDKVFISYRFLLDETDDKILFITKIEQDKETEEETVNELRFTFNQETSSLEVVVNDILLFDEIQDFTEDQKKKLQVIDKLNKFTFLASEELRKLEKEIKEKEEAEKERRKLQEIFRNF